MDVILEGRIFYSGALTHGCIGIKDGKIVKVAKTLGTQNVLNLGNMIIAPGGVDIHVHMREPGLTKKEDFLSGSNAAAAGGTTFFLDMPNTSPPTSNLERLAEKIDSASKSMVDYGLHALAGPSATAELGNRATGWKWYYGPSTGTVAWDDIASAKNLFRSSPGFTTLHAEDPRLFGPPGKDIAGHDRARPAECEISAVKKIASNGIFGLHVAHCSTSHCLLEAEKAGYSSEVTLHHLLLDTSSSRGAFAKVNPPLRGEVHRRALFESFLRGDTIVASDHAPHTMEEKEQEFSSAPSGMPGVEERLPVLMAMAKRGHIPVERVLRACCERPAMLLGLSKGKIAEGYDADIAVFDPRELLTMKNEDAHSKCGWTPYMGLEIIRPYYVFLRGECIVERGDVVGKGGEGIYVGHAPSLENGTP